MVLRSYPGELLLGESLVIARIANADALTTQYQNYR
jgi:hypothetical protein